MRLQLALEVLHPFGALLHARLQGSRSCVSRLQAEEALEIVEALAAISLDGVDDLLSAEERLGADAGRTEVLPGSESGHLPAGHFDRASRRELNRDLRLALERVALPFLRQVGRSAEMPGQGQRQCLHNRRLARRVVAANEHRVAVQLNREWIADAAEAGDGDAGPRGDPVFSDSEIRIARLGLRVALKRYPTSLQPLGKRARVRGDAAQLAAIDDRELLFQRGMAPFRQHLLRVLVLLGIALTEKRQ